MVPLEDSLVFLGVATLMVLTPGPNMLYLLSRSPLEARALPIDPPRRLYLMGFLTCFLNPKVAVLYLSIFPQFIAPAQGPLFLQGLQLGLMQMLISFCANGAVVLGAAWLAAQLAHSPRWLAAQRYVMGSVLAALALRLAVDPQRARV